MAQNANLCRDLIRSKLSRFINNRERAYGVIVKKGFTVPEYDIKMRAIKFLRIQLDASRDWDLQSHLRWISAMRQLITTLLPFEFHDDPKQRAYRKHMVDLLNYCNDLLNTTPHFINPKLKAA